MELSLPGKTMVLQANYHYWSCNILYWRCRAEAEREQLAWSHLVGSWQKQDSSRERPGLQLLALLYSALFIFVCTWLVWDIRCWKKVDVGLCGLTSMCFRSKQIPELLVCTPQNAPVSGMSESSCWIKRKRAIGEKILLYQYLTLIECLRDVNAMYSNYLFRLVLAPSGLFLLSAIR